MDLNITDDWIQNTYSELRLSYKDADIFNGGKLEIFKLMPDKILKFKSKKCASRKLSKKVLQYLYVRT